MTVESTETVVHNRGEILARVIIPAQYKTITKQVLVSPARAVERHVPAVTKDITVKVANEDGSYSEVIRTFVIKEAHTDIDVIPAVYETRSERVLVATARDEWKPGSEAFNSGEIIKPVAPPPPPPPCLLYTSPSPRDQRGSRMPSSA